MIRQYFNFNGEMLRKWLIFKIYMIYVINLCCIYSIEIARKLLEKEIDERAKMFWRSIFYKEKKPTNCTKKFSKFYRHTAWKISIYN